MDKVTEEEIRDIDDDVDRLLPDLYRYSSIELRIEMLQLRLLWEIKQQLVRINENTRTTTRHPGR